ncbi:class I SAM-dependent methyltransferase [Leptolyngbya sp. 7M]|uniref:class I SAM-dependent methyltransferase n=1 Tax=Leptolyngbya sp. 7M TaxID=2812896 RepID=UPI001B8BEBF0|nr:class I SAM-dependent methyltransferase [Leptolyngbya sp. 7M]QYO67242.1 class I SAM-dependent methyltransferase [Leptolyngbya sp. 7M]
MNGSKLDRLEWAVGLINVKPNDRILEIGCGYGRAVSLVCEKLITGMITAIDRSSKMANAAKDANVQNIIAGRAEILHADLLSSDLPEAAFDKVFLFNINVFWMDPVAELNAIRRLLEPGGIFYLFHQPPPGHKAEEFAEKFKENLGKNRFDIKDIQFGNFASSDAVCITSQPHLQ